MLKQGNILSEKEESAVESEKIESLQAEQMSETTSNEPLPNQELYQTVKLNENLDVQEEVFASFKQLAAELKLSPETVQKLLDWEANIGLEERKKRSANRGEILQKWTTQTKEMFGPRYQHEVGRALRAVEQFGGAELRQLLDATGLGSHPVIVKTFHAISQQISEDCSVGAGSHKQTDKTFAEALYGKDA